MNVFRERKKLVTLIVIVGMLLALPLFLWQTGRIQDLRQRASVGTYIPFGSNILANPGFEIAGGNPAANWRQWNNIGSLVLSTERAHSGSYSLKGNNSDTVWGISAANDITVAANTRYRLSGWIYRESSTEAYLDLGDPENMTDCYAASTLMNTWEEVICDFTTSSSTTTLAVRTVAGANGVSIWFDDISLLALIEATPTPTPIPPTATPQPTSIPTSIPPSPTLTPVPTAFPFTGRRETPQDGFCNNANIIQLGPLQGTVTNVNINGYVYDKTPGQTSGTFSVYFPGGAFVRSGNFDNQEAANSAKFAEYQANNQPNNPGDPGYARDQLSLQIFRNTFLKVRGETGYNPKYDFTGDCVVDERDTPGLTAAGIAVPTPIPVSQRGDANGDGLVNLLDFGIWKDQFLGISTSRTADFNNDGAVNLLDFGIWKDAYLASL